MFKTTDVNVTVNTSGYGGQYGDAALPVSLDKVVGLFEISAQFSTPCVVSIIGENTIRCLSTTGTTLNNCKVRVVYTD